MSLRPLDAFRSRQAIPRNNVRTQSMSKSTRKSTRMIENGLVVELTAVEMSPQCSCSYSVESRPLH